MMPPTSIRPVTLTLTLCLAAGAFVASCRDFDAATPGPERVVASGGVGTGGRAGASGGQQPSAGGTASGGRGASGGDSASGGSDASAGDGDAEAGALDAADGDADAAEHTSQETGTPPPPNPDSVITPPCMTQGGSHPALQSFGVAGDVTLANTMDGQHKIVATLPARHLLALTWELAVNGSNWLQWLCFDVVVDPQRVAGVNLENDAPEFYATALGGRLLHRRHFPSVGAWGAWMPLSSPSPGAEILDVAAIGGADASLFVATMRGVFARRTASTSPGSTFGPWRSLGHPGALRLAAEPVAAGRQRVWAADIGGRLITTEGALTELAETLPVWLDVATPERIADLATATSIAGAPYIFTRDRAGAVWWRDGSSAWLTAPPAQPQLVSLTAGSHPGQEPLLVGVDTQGQVKSATYPYTTWSPVP